MSFKAKIYIITFIIAISFKTVYTQPINQTSFESFSDEHQYTLSSWTAEGFTVPWVNGFNQSRAFVDNAYARNGSNSLRIHFPAGEYGPANSGAQAPLKVSEQNQLYISYWVRFSDNFSWGTTSEGGKLPGLGGGGNCSGCNNCSGTNGFSARLMWRTGGKAVLYLYHMDKSGSCGDNITLQYNGADFYFQKGVWYQISERVKVNTGNNFDGEVQLWINQQPALSVNGIRFVNNGDKVDNLYFSTFHGGSTAAWSPVVDCHIWFDDVIITANPSDIFTALGIDQEYQSLPIPKGLPKADPNIYPNPVFPNQLVSIQTENEVVEQVQLADIAGRNNHLFYSDSFVLPNLAPGIYLLKIRFNDRVTVKKINVN